MTNDQLEEYIYDFLAQCNNSAFCGFYIESFHGNEKEFIHDYVKHKCASFRHITNEN